MYESAPVPPEAADAASRWRRWPAVSANVWFLGITSLFTDISSEMVTAVLPLYLVLHLQMTPLAFGTIDGVYQGAAGIVRAASGFVADRRRRYKAVAALGYGLSTLAKLGYLAAGPAWTPLVAAIVGDRIGKGIRTAPRDALVSLSVSRGQLGAAFGLHRAMDAAGSMLGPLVAFGLLFLVPGRFDVVFLTSFWIAAVGVAALVLLVQTPAAPAAAAPGPLVTLGSAVSLLGARDFRPIVVSACALAAATMSDAFIYLMVQRRAQFDAAWVPMLFVGTRLSYFVLAGPMGVLADRWGSRVVFVIGHVVLLLTYGVLLSPGEGVAVPVACVALLGAYYAATDGVLAALASAIVPAALRGTGLSIVATGTSAARVLASLAFGVAWTWWGPERSVILFAIALLAGIVVAVGQLRRLNIQP